jgi:hypothetical protein
MDMYIDYKKAVSAIAFSGLYRPLRCPFEATLGGINTYGFLPDFS